MKKILIFIISLSFTLYAQNNIKSKIEIGFNGVVPSKTGIIPIKVSLENNYKDVSGVIVVTQPDNLQMTEVRQELPFISPNHSKKEFMFYPFLYQHRSINVRIEYSENVKGEHDAYFKQNRKIEQDIILNIGIRKSFYQMKDPKKWTEKYRVIDIKPGDVDKNQLVKAYETVKYIFIDASEFIKLPQKTFTQLNDWVYKGGKLFILNPSTNDNFRMATKDFKLDGIFQGDYGKVNYAAGQIAWQKLKADGEKAFWLRENQVPVKEDIFPKLKKVKNSDDLNNMDFSAYGMNQFNNNLGLLENTNNDQSYDFGGFVWLTLIITVYILVIGPLDYLIVKKLGKPWFTWVIFLISISAFSFIAYWYSSIAHSKSKKTVQVSFIDYIEGDKTLYGHSVLWIYSTRNKKYEIASDNKDSVMTVREADSATRRSSVITASSPPQLTSYIPVFSSRTVDCRWTIKQNLNIQNINNKDNFEFKVPVELNAKEVYLVDSNNKVYQLSNANDKWSGSSKNAKNMNSYQNKFEANIYDRNKEAYESYAKFITFVNLNGASKKLDKMNSVEASLSKYKEISDSKSQYLIIVCENNMLNFNQNTKSEEEHKVNVLRVQLLGK